MMIITGFEARTGAKDHFQLFANGRNIPARHNVCVSRFRLNHIFISGGVK